MSGPAQTPIRVDGRWETPAPRDRVWAVLTDATAIAACLPVPAVAEIVPPDRFRVTVTVTYLVFPVRIVVDGRFVDRAAPARAVVAATASVPGGTVEVEARLELDTAPGNRTTLRWEVEAVPAGTAAALGGDRVPAAVGAAVERTLACLAVRMEE